MSFSGGEDDYGNQGAMKLGLLEKTTRNRPTIVTKASSATSCKGLERALKHALRL